MTISIAIATPKNDMNDNFVTELLTLVAELQTLGVTNDFIIHKLSQLQHKFKQETQS